MIRVVTGDCRDVLAQFQPETFDCAIADPPYGQTAMAWDKRVDGWLSSVRRVLKPSASLWVFGTLRSFMAMSGEFKGWRLAQDVIWEKQNGTGFDNQRFRRVHEQVAQFYRDDAPWRGVFRDPQFTMDAKRRSVRAKETRLPHTGKIGPHIYESADGGPRLMRSVLKIRNTHRQNSGHATQKPSDLYERLIRYSCPPGGLLLDPFAGSGTAGVVADRLHCDAVLIELSPVYADMAARRLSVDAGMFANVEECRP